jgi:hypothetical protein
LLFSPWVSLSFSWSFHWVRNSREEMSQSLAVLTRD